ncbi:hypothetical protein ES703_93933 [subsurface metagenome]
MMKSPKSLTATIYVRFHYEEPEGSPLFAGQTEMVGRILDQANDLDPDLQEILVKFADHLSTQGQEKAEQSPK